MSRNASRRKGKSKISPLLLLVAVVIIIAVSLAFFSDTIINILPGTAGTVNIDQTTSLSIKRHYIVGGNENYYSGTTIILNPGDIVEVAYAVSNVGNKSAWIRDIMSIDIGENYLGNQPTVPGVFRLYSLDVSRADIRNPEVVTTPLAISTVHGLEYITEVEIINGTGFAAETEYAGIDGERFIGFQIYFIHTAPREYQGINVAFRFTTQAMQYRNNTNPNWTNVVDDEFVLGETTHPRIRNKVRRGEMQIGDFVAYTPDSPNTSHTVLGIHRTSNGGEDVTHIRENLQWRVLDVLPTGEVRLISATPTEWTLALQGPNGYNNGVRIIDELASIYGGSLGIAQNIKIEDVKKHLTWDYRGTIGSGGIPYGGTRFETTGNRGFPNIWRYERGSIINGELTGGTLGLSQQEEWIFDRTTSAGSTSITITQTHWSRITPASDWTAPVYHQLFTRNLLSSGSVPGYWLSSRALNINSNNIGVFGVRNISGGDGIVTTWLAGTDGSQLSPNIRRLRPVITLGEDVRVDMDIGSDGTTSSPWNIF